MPLTSVHPPETTVSIPPHATVAGNAIDGFDLSEPDRHASWAPVRRRVAAAFRDANVSRTRRENFDSCGRGAWVMKHRDDPTKFLAVPMRCHDRFCTPCAHVRAHRIRCNLSEHLPDSPVRFVTLTLKSGQEPLVLLIDRLLEAFGKLKKTGFWKKHVNGGACFLEVKYCDDTHRWHPHLHVLTTGIYMPKQELRALWQSLTVDSFIVDITLVRSREHVLRYVTKYVTKSYDPSFLREPALLAEAILAMRGRRLCAAFGSWKVMHLLDPGTTGDWVLLCTMFALKLTASQGSPDAVAVLAALARKDGLGVTYDHGARDPPTLWQVEYEPDIPTPSVEAQFKLPLRLRPRPVALSF